MKWTALELSLTSLIFGVLYSSVMIYIINYFKGLKMRDLLLVGAASLAFANFGNYALYYAESIPFWLQFTIQIVMSCFQGMATDLPQIAVIGRFSKKCPEGFESTGITLLISFSNTAVLLSGISAANLLQTFAVRTGHYDNLIYPVIYTHYYSLVLVFICPFFAIW